MNHISLVIRGSLNARRSAKSPVPWLLLGMTLTWSSLPPQVSWSQTAAPVPGAGPSAATLDARTAATQDVLRRAQVAIDRKDYREAVELYRRAKVNAQSVPALQSNVQALRQSLAGLGFDASLLDMPPSAPPEVANQQAAGVTPQLMPMPLGAKSLPTVDPAAKKADALRLIAEGRRALDRGDVATAQRLAVEAEALAVPDSAFAAGEPRLWQLRLDVDSAARRAGSVPAMGAVQQASGVVPVGDLGAQNSGVVQSVFNPNGDNTKVQTVQAIAPLGGNPGEALFREGMDALTSGNAGRARELFTEAWKHEATMDLATRNQLKEKLTLMQPGRLPSTKPETPAADLTPIQKADLEAKAENLKVYREVTAELAAINTIKTEKPIEALERLEALQAKVRASRLDTAATNSMLAMVDKVIREQEGYVEANRGDIDLKLANEAVMAEMASDATNRERTDDEIASLVETFNDLMEERRYPEAEVVAKKVNDLAPGSSIATLLIWKSRMGTRSMESEDISRLKENNVAATFMDLDRTGIPIDPSRDYQMPDAKTWVDLSGRRLENGDGDMRLSVAEKEIKRRLDTPVDINYKNRPIAEVMQDLSAVTNIPIVLDARAMEEMRVSSDSPVTLELSRAISLKSALNLILANYDMTYVIKNDVLNITSVEAKRSMVYPITYRVTDLVTPIPNFSASYEDGLAGALRAAHQMNKPQADVQLMPVSMTDLANRNRNLGAAQTLSPNMLAQYHSMGSQGGFGLNSPPGAGGGGGAAFADFDSLMTLIQTTVQPDTWEALGGPSTMSPYAQNLSLVISTTSEVHDQIAELLASLRRLQNLQVTIEVRFITLSDQFFEQIGVDFDVQFDDNVNTVPDEDSSPSVTVGFNGLTGLPTNDFDIQLRQNLGVAPTLGAFDPQAASTIGFAILSDIEAFFFLQAAQGDSRNNVLQAPKVTLFDGQLATISDVTQRPFVTSITPVVGDFAVAQQPVIVVLNEGTQLNVQAIVSDDKRFVRLTLVPFFSQIGNVDTFTYEGTRRRRSSSEEIDPTTGEPIQDDEEEEVVVGTTVQLPTFAFTSVSTTVSVPDGGTILLGGIKRLAESRLERGVPILSKIPYVSRLFRNVAISRDARSLMLMVTPRIIIEEEEEIAQTGFDPKR